MMFEYDSCFQQLKMNQKLDIPIFTTIIILLLISQASAGEVGGSSSKSQCSLHRRKFLEEISELQNDGLLHDLAIIVGDKQFQVHKLAMAAASPYFKAMFKNKKMRKSTEQSDELTVHLNDLDAGAFEMIKDYIYTKEIQICDSNVAALLAAASYLQMTDVIYDCCDHMKKNLNTMNCLTTRNIADKYSCADLLQSATAFALDAFEVVAQNDDFLGLTLDQLVGIISEDSLNVNSEENVYEAAMRWIRYQDISDNDRTLCLPALMQHVRFSQMEPKYFERVSKDPLIRKCPECLENVREAKDYLLEFYRNLLLKHHISSKCDDDDSSVETRFKPRGTNYLFAVGGSINKQSTSNVERYDPKINKWTEVAPMNSRRSSVGVTTLNEILYAVGGYTGSFFLSTIECYDPYTGEWTGEVKPLQLAVTSHNLIATLNGILYFISESFGSRSNWVVKYDSRTDEWIECKPLKQKRSHYAVGVLDSYIYVLGGLVNGQHSNMVELYDSIKNEWHSVTPMITARVFLASAACKGYLYAVGGRMEDDRPLNSAERYNARENRWELVPPMNEHRSVHGLAVANGLLYVAGGINLNKENLDTVEVYDPEINVWSKRAPMLHARSDFGLGAMKF